MTYRKKPVVIDAVRFMPEPGKIENEMFMEFPVQQDERGSFITIPTLEGNHRADVGDWIITGIKGEKYPCKDDVFQMTYESVPSEPEQGQGGKSCENCRNKEKTGECVFVYAGEPLKLCHHWQPKPDKKMSEAEIELAKLLKYMAERDARIARLKALCEELLKLYKKGPAWTMQQERERRIEEDEIETRLKMEGVNI